MGNKYTLPRVSGASFLFQWYGSNSCLFHRCFNVMKGNQRGIVTDLHLVGDWVQTERCNPVKGCNLLLNDLAFTGTAEPFDPECRYLQFLRFTRTANHGRCRYPGWLCLTVTATGTVRNRRFRSRCFSGGGRTGTTGSSGTTGFGYRHWYYRSRLRAGAAGSTGRG